MKIYTGGAWADGKAHVFTTPSTGVNAVQDFVLSIEQETYYNEWYGYSIVSQPYGSLTPETINGYTVMELIVMDGEQIAFEIEEDDNDLPESFDITSGGYTVTVSLEDGSTNRWTGVDWDLGNYWVSNNGFDVDVQIDLPAPPTPQWVEGDVYVHTNGDWVKEAEEAPPTGHYLLSIVYWDTGNDNYGYELTNGYGSINPTKIEDKGIREFSVVDKEMGQAVFIISFFNERVTSSLKFTYEGEEFIFARTELNVWTLDWQSDTFERLREIFSSNVDTTIDCGLEFV